jgi:hypothetical protein
MVLFSRQGSLGSSGRYIFLLALAVASLWHRPALSDALNDAIRQADQAKEESQRMARDSDESRQKASQLYNETKLVKFQLARDEFSAASSDFERAADSFNRARYYLELMQKNQNPAHVPTIEEHFRDAGRHSEEAVRRSRRGSEWFNGGIEEYDRQLREERKRQAEKNNRDSFDLMKTIEKRLQAAKSQKGSAVTVACLDHARGRANWAFNNFLGAAGNADREDTYREKFQAGIRDYNEAVQTLKKLSETGQCNK